MNLPNKLTLSRILAVLIFIPLIGMILYYGDQELSYSKMNEKTILFIVAGSLFSVAMFTDFLDGYLARRWNLVTEFGKLFDPLADKFMTSTALIALSLMKITPFWIPVITILRDILVDGSRNVAAKNNIAVAASLYGKVKTYLQSVAIVSIFILMPALSIGEFSDFVTAPWELWMMNLVLIIATALSVISGWKYFSRIIPIIGKDK